MPRPTVPQGLAPRRPPAAPRRPRLAAAVAVWPPATRGASSCCCRSVTRGARRACHGLRRRAVHFVAFSSRGVGAQRCGGAAAGVCCRSGVGRRCSKRCWKTFKVASSWVRAAFHWHPKTYIGIIDSLYLGSGVVKAYRQA